MRNLKEFPITNKEAIQVLEKIKNNFNSNLIGDIRPVILENIIGKFVSGEFSIETGDDHD